MHILYLSHDGALDPLGQSQILPYLVRLSSPQKRITLLTYEKAHRLAQPAAIERVRAICTMAGITWIALRYHRRPPVMATLWDMGQGLWRAWRIVRREHVDLIHARSYVMACIGVILKRLTEARLLFDMRELWVDGRVDGGAWPRGGWLHRLGKRCERWCLTQADAIVSLTERGKQIVEGFPYWEARRRPPILVIPTCVDVERFRNHLHPPASRPEALTGRRAVVYLGSIGSWYRLDAMADFIRTGGSLWPDVLFVVLTPQPVAAKAQCRARGLRTDQVAIHTVRHEEVPAYLQWMEASLYFIAPSYAKQSSCPTKLGESLAAGLPVVTNRGIGDQDVLLATHRVGVLIDSLMPQAYERAWRELTTLLEEGEALRRRCRRVAQDVLGIDRGVATYQRAYEQVDCP